MGHSQLHHRGQGAPEESCCLASDPFAPLSYGPSTAFYSLNSLWDVGISAKAQGFDSLGITGMEFSASATDGQEQVHPPAL